MAIKYLVGLDRDDTLNLDKLTYFGVEPNWKELLKIIDGVYEGLKKLSAHPEVALAVVTNQVGIAKGKFDEQRVIEINEYMDELFKEEGIKIDSWQYSPYSDKKGAQRWKDKGVKNINWNYILEDDDLRLQLIKPNDGMMRKACEEIGADYNQLEKYIIGDSTSDAKAAIQAGGTGIIVTHPEIKEGKNARYQAPKIEEMMQDPQYEGKVHWIHSMVDAADLILEEIQRI